MLMGSRQEAEALWLLGAGSAWFLVCGGRALMCIFPSGHWGGVRVLFVPVAMFSKSSEKTVREARRRSYLKSCSFGTSVISSSGEPRPQLPSEGPRQQHMDSSGYKWQKPMVRNSPINCPLRIHRHCGWHPQLSACWVGTDSDNRPAGNPEFSMTPSSFPRHLPGRCCKHRVLTLYWSPTVDETQVPLLRELTVLWREMKMPWPSEVWFQPCMTTLLTAGELLIQSYWGLQPTGEKGHINTSWSIFTEDVLWAVDQSCPWTRAISVE